ncbi:unnamed protein product [Owenia fusiformis]|uniref:Uncharacterized protein n=1 Tax=Owenia fusiformis TaxID=6347 RepID=A0A8S4NV56_OWEFU|nr:unnamed protein product [Owenia fusiformis]
MSTNGERKSRKEKIVRQNGNNDRKRDTKSQIKQSNKLDMKVKTKGKEKREKSKQRTVPTIDSEDKTYDADKNEFKETKFPPLEWEHSLIGRNKRTVSESGELVCKEDLLAVPFTRVRRHSSASPVRSIVDLDDSSDDMIDISEEISKRLREICQRRRCSETRQKDFEDRQEQLANRCRKLERRRSDRVANFFANITEQNDSK